MQFYYFELIVNFKKVQTEAAFCEVTEIKSLGMIFSGISGSRQKIPGSDFPKVPGFLRSGPGPGDFPLSGTMVNLAKTRVITRIKCSRAVLYFGH